MSIERKCATCGARIVFIGTYFGKPLWEHAVGTLSWNPHEAVPSESGQFMWAFQGSDSDLAEQWQKNVEKVLTTGSGLLRRVAELKGQLATEAAYLADQRRLEWLMESGAHVVSIDKRIDAQGRVEKRYYLRWSHDDKNQKDWFESPRAAIDAQMKVPKVEVENVIQSVYSEKYLLTDKFLVEVKENTPTHYWMHRSALRDAFRAGNGHIVYYFLGDKEGEPRNRYAGTPAVFRDRNGTVWIGCKGFHGQNALRLKQWALA